MTSTLYIHLLQCNCQQFTFHLQDSSCNTTENCYVSLLQYRHYSLSSKSVLHPESHSQLSQFLHLLNYGNIYIYICLHLLGAWGSVVAKALRCAASRKVSGSIPSGVAEAYAGTVCPGVDSASKNE
jgi:hypothetical protein